MTISSTKCIEFAVKPQFAANGKPNGYAVVGRAHIHDKFEVVKHRGDILMRPDCIDVEIIRDTLRRELESRKCSTVPGS